MKVRVVLTLEVDPREWQQVYAPGRVRTDIREDVRDYVTNAVGSTAAALDGLLTVTNL